MTDTLISLRGAVKDYGSKRIGPVDFEVRSGEAVGLLGPNGSGKTTCIRMITGLVKPSSGEVRVRGMDPLREHARAMRHVGYSPELPNLQLFMTPRSLLEFTASLTGLPRFDAAAEARRVLEEVGLTGYSDQKIGKLSKGMVQRLSLAQALIGRPSVLVLDEPMIGVDPAGTMHLRSLFKEFVRGGGGLLLSSHSMGEVEALCTSITMMHLGKVLFSGEIGDVVSKTLATRRIRLECAPVTPALVESLRTIPGVLSVSEEDHALVLEARSRGGEGEVDEDVRPAVAQTVVSSGSRLFSLDYESNQLERVYTQALEESSRER